MRRDRLYLTSTDLLKLLMENAPEGKPMSIRTLASKAQVSKSKVSNLVNGGPYPTVDTDAATRITKALGVHRRALFQPQASTSMDVDIEED